MTSIPAFHVSTKSQAKGKGQVFIANRKTSTLPGLFTVAIDARFNPTTDDYPTGKVVIKSQMFDSLVGTFTSTSIELINSYGKYNPTVYLTGRCKADAARAPKGLRFWVMIADNRFNERDTEGSPEVVGFAIHDSKGNRVAYGCGALKDGGFEVQGS